MFVGYASGGVGLDLGDVGLRYIWKLLLVDRGDVKFWVRMMLWGRYVGRGI